MAAPDDALLALSLALLLLGAVSLAVAVIVAERRQRRRERALDEQEALVAWRLEASHALLLRTVRLTRASWRVSGRAGR